MRKKLHQYLTRQSFIHHIQKCSLSTVQYQLQYQLILVFLFSTIFVAHAQSWEFTKQITGSNFEEAREVIQDDSGYVYVVGRFNTVINIDNITLTTATVATYIAKFDSTGNAIWATSFDNNSGFNFNYNIAVDDSGNVYCTGGSQTGVGAINFGNGVIATPNSNTNNPFYQTFLVKFNSSGVAQWAKMFSSSVNISNVDRPVVCDDAGNIYVAGTYSEIFKVNNSTILNLANSEGGFLLKFNSAGVLQWSRTITTDFWVSVFDLLITDDNSRVIPVGYTSTASFNGTNQLFVSKHDTPLGNQQTSLTTTSAASGFQNMRGAINENNEIFITGNFSSNIIINGTTYTSTSGFDGFLLKVNSNNTWGFLKQIINSNSSFTNGLVAQNGDVAIAIGGSSFVLVDSTLTLSDPNQFSVVWLLFSDNGEFEMYQTIRNIGASNFGYFKSLIGLAGNGFDAYYGVGEFSVNAIFDKDTLFAQGGSDYFLTKISCIPDQVGALIGDTIVCAGTEIYRLPQTKLGKGIDYQWSLSSGGTFTQGDTFITVNWTTVGTHTITVSPYNGCGVASPTTITVNVIDVPDADTINGSPTACLGQSTYNVTNDPFDNYTWTISGGGAIFPIGNTAIVNWAATGNYNVNVVPSNQCGIGPMTTFPVTVKAIPSEPSPIVGNNNVCVSTQTYSITSVTNVNYNWSISSGGTITSNNNIATINWTSAGNHTIIVTPTNECGTGSSRTLTVTVNDVPVQPSTVIGNLNVCKNSSEVYSVVGSTTTNYTWTISGGGILTSAGSSASVVWTSPGTHTLTISPANVCGTGTPRSVNIIVRDVPSQAGNIIGLDTVCIGQQGYQIPSQQGVNYTWTISGGGTILPLGNAATVDWSVAGTHTITVTPYNTCGTGLSRSMVVVVKNINSAFSSITGEDTVCLGIENYSVPNINGISYNWSVNGGGTLTQVNNTAFMDWTGTGVYTLNVATSDGCNSAINVDVRDAPSQPSPIAGDAVVCIGTYNYGVNVVNDVNYSWTLSGGGILIENNNLATINWTTPGIYTLSVTPFNDCGSGAAQSLTIDVRTIPSAPSSITGDTLVCVGTEIYTVPNDPTVNYNWSLSNSGATVIINNNNQANINWQTIDTNTITVTATNLCGTSPQTTLAVEVLDIPSPPTITGDTTVCFGNQNYNINTSSSLLSNTNYTWSLGSGGILTTNNPSNASVNWTTAGAHNLTVNASNICGAASASTLTVNAIDVPAQPTAITGASAVCQSLQSYSVPSLQNTNYTWTLSSGGAISALGNVANINWTTAGTHTITVTPFNSCGTGTSITKTVTVTGIPSQPSPISGASLTCLGTVNYSIINTNNVAYIWTLNGGGTLTTSGNTASVAWTQAGTYTLTVLPQSSCGTGLAQSLTIQVGDVPNLPQLNTGDTAVCLGTQLYSVNAATNTSYNWTLSGGGNLNASANNASVNWNSTGTHTLAVTPSNTCGNGSTLSLTVDVANIPNAIASISGNDNICAGTETYTIPTTAGETYTWTLSSGGLLSANGGTATVNWLTAGTHTLSVVPSNGCGVAPLTSIIVTVNDLPAQPIAITGIQSICENTTTSYTISGIVGTSYTWSIDGGGTVASSGNSADITWTTPGNYTISVAPSNTCGTGAAQTLNVEVRANDLVSSVITGDTLVCNGSEVFYTADFDNNLDYDWLISGNGNLTPVSNSAVVQWQEAGVASIGLIASSDCGVGDTAFINVRIEAPLAVPSIAVVGDSLIASNTTGITWYLDDIATPITTDFLIPQIEGDYTITNSNICGETAESFPVTIGGRESGLFLFPNPARNTVRLHFPLYLRWYSFDIIDYKGALVIPEQTYNGSSEVSINIETLQSGLYLVRVYTELGYFYVKLVVA